MLGIEVRVQDQIAIKNDLIKNKGKAASLKKSLALGEIRGS